MKVIKNNAHGYSFDPLRTCNFEDYEDRANDCIFFWGSQLPPEIHNDYGNTKKILLANEGRLKVVANYMPALNENLHKFDKVLVWYPPELDENRANKEYVFWPFNPQYTPEIEEKIYDVVYVGLASPYFINDLIPSMTKFNYRYIAQGATGHNAHVITNFNVTYEEKLKLLAQTKCTIVHNLMDDNTPQLKSRAFEAAFSRSIILCLKDDYNILEKWFKPNKEFLYFSNKSELEEIVEKISKDYDSYKHIADNAYKKASKNYTVEKFIEKYIGFKK